MNVDQVCADIIKTEGGYCNRRNDNGGATNHGVSLVFARSLPKVNGRSPMDLNGDGVVDEKDILLVTPAIAEALFKEHFFLATRTNELPACIQAITFDENVNGGPGGGGKMVQLALLNLGALLNVDGQVGNQTIALAGKVHARVGDKQMVNACVDARIAMYHRIVDRDASQKEFLQGWINRASRFRQ